MPLSLASPITEISGVGPTIARKLNKLNIKTCLDLLWHLPYKYDDFSKILPIKKLTLGETATIKGRIQQIKNRRSWKRRLNITEAIVSDNSGSIKCIWFNQPYLTQTLKNGSLVFLAGKLEQTNYGLQFDNPTYELVNDINIHTGRLVPRYPLTAGLTPRLIRNLIIKVLPLSRNIEDWLPTPLTKKISLPNIGQAINYLHYPTDDRQIITARRRLAFDELLLLRLASFNYQQKMEQQAAPAIRFNQQTKKLVTSLPWPLTTSQRSIAWQIIKDLNKTKPMNRLLQGDVGSGKTVVAGIAAFNALLAGYQVVLLAPTEILAQQHFKTLTKLLSDWNISLALLTNSQKIIFHQQTERSITKQKIIKKINQGELQFIIGTHAIIANQLSLPKLGLLIIDEQHRFGVAQRQKLLTDSKLYPHLLSLTATPIPRSLALTIYGNLDISLLKELPAERLPIITKIITPTNRSQAYELIRQQIAHNNRVYIVCPLIEESDVLGVKSVTQEKDKLQTTVFQDISLGILHGRLPNKEKNKIMEDFRTGRNPILITTTVVEVGIDVPEATVMMIEDADRFGLSQLHQLRGRVGRSSRQSYCLLSTNDSKQINNPRLQALVKFRSGFELAEKDLALRGPGNLLGTTQSGWPNLKYASWADSQLLEQVRLTTDWLTKQYKISNFPTINEKIAQYFYHPE